MPKFDKSNTLTINPVPAEKRTERGPVLRVQLHLDVQALKADGWDGKTPLKGALWLREGVGRDDEPYRFWSGPIEVDEWLQERAQDDGDRAVTTSPSRRAAEARRPVEDEDIPF
jgi:hypothetical protein